MFFYLFDGKYYILTIILTNFDKENLFLNSFIIFAINLLLAIYLECVFLEIVYNTTIASIEILIFKI